MNSRVLLAHLFNRGFRLDTIDDNIRIVQTLSAITPELLSEVQSKKSELLDLLKFYQGLRVGQLVQTPSSAGNIWEFYPQIWRCGVWLPDYDWPLFFGYQDIYPLNKRGK